MNKKIAMYATGALIATGCGFGLVYYVLKRKSSSGCNASSCPIGSVCVNRVCEPVECVVDSECKGGKVCEGYRCSDPFCDSTKKCVNRTDKCSAGRCVPGRCPTDYECLDGSVCDTVHGSCIIDQGCTASGFVCPSGTLCDKNSKKCLSAN